MDEVEIVTFHPLDKLGKYGVVTICKTGTIDEPAVTVVAVAGSATRST